MNLSKLREEVEDREAWRAPVHRVAKSQTQPSDSTTATTTNSHLQINTEIHYRISTMWKIIQPFKSLLSKSINEIEAWSRHMDKQGGKEQSKLHIDCDPNIVNMSYVFIPKKTEKKCTKITKIVTYGQWDYGYLFSSLHLHFPNFLQWIY